MSNENDVKIIIPESSRFPHKRELMKGKTVSKYKNTMKKFVFEKRKSFTEKKEQKCFAWDLQTFGLLPGFLGLQSLVNSEASLKRLRK